MTLVVRTEDDYEDLLGLWADLEAGLGLLLAHPQQVQEFVPRVAQYDRWMRDLMRHDADVGFYLLFQLASSSPVGYSASHALVCAVLCHQLAQALELPEAQRNALVHAAFTMNVAMTALQDELAHQRGRPSPQQQAQIASHAQDGQRLLQQLGVADALWLDIVGQHHVEPNAAAPWLPGQPATAAHLAAALQLVDRYAAMISPRETREGRSAAETARSLLSGAASRHPAAQALLDIVGLCPPGTYVRLNDDSVAVVLRRGAQPNQPDVAVLFTPAGQRVHPPRLHHTAQAEPHIRAALNSAAVQERIHHHLILQMGLASGRTSP